MALSRADAARRQPRPVRTEQEVAADVIMRLFDQALLRMDPNVMARVADAAGVAVPALRAAKHRADQRGYLPPATTCAIATVPEPANGRQWANEQTARAHAAGRANGQRHWAARKQTA